eukprot:TRINITY_DN2664_c0_g1_i1.p1 TRINITY_DN2664_c0_g1~~TRINITY_DN2664_c0_g1_i1.p1  ORF type:complete len:799 (+),score=300.59 TRINITY_DN2664_c0_g1_i1:102-2399(+)
MRGALILAAAGAATAERAWMNRADPPEVRAAKLVAEMTTDEKIALFHGSCSGYVGNVCANDRLKIPAIKMNDGPQGFRGIPGTSTAWPAALTVASSWDESIAREWGTAMGDEFYRKGANVQLGPGVCVARVPRNGRNFEYVSGEDPYLGFRMVQPVVEGIQSKGVVANAKHFINNNQETNRGTISENLDERTEFEIYLPPFEGALKANVGSIMCSYNKICMDCGEGQIGNWSCENSDTLRGDYKGRMGFKGWVMSDWGATHSASIARGLDQEMPGSTYMGAKLAGMVKSGEVTQAMLDDSAQRILWPLFMVGAFDVENNNTLKNNVTTPEHNALARRISASGMILLKNAGVLPIASSAKTVAVIGAEALTPTSHGGGSGKVDPPYVAAPLNSIRAHYGLAPPGARPNNCSNGAFEHDIDYFNQDDQTSAPAATAEDCCQLCGARAGCAAFTLADGTCWMKADAKGRRAKSGAVSGVCAKGPLPPDADCKGGFCVKYADGTDLGAAAAAAAAADVAVVFAGTTSSEGGDRADLTLGKQDDLIAAVAKAAGKKTVVVAITPGALLTPWRDDVAAVITTVFPGQEYGNAVADVLFGAVNPGGKLPITFPGSENEMQMSQTQWPGVKGYAVYSEKLEVGYRWYAAHGVKPAFPFGHGLSYTTFEYAGLQAGRSSVSCTIKNAGPRAGSEVAQLYLKFPDSAGEPPKQLKGFQKVHLAPGASQTVTFALDDRSYSIWNVSTHAWAVQHGSFGVMVGSSSEDIRLTGTITA